MSTIESRRVLVVDDDRELCELLERYLGGEGFVVESVADGEAGVARAVAGAADVVVLDVMLPGVDGFEALRRIRAACDVPVLMLTARGDEVDRIVGLEIGADDYLPKPFNPRELAARLRAILRRAGGELALGTSEPRILRVDDLELDLGARTATCGSETVRLTGTEFSLLELLARNAGQVMTREQLSREVLERRPSAFDRSLDVHVSNLRRKLGPRPDGDDRIKTVRGRGYVLTVRTRGAS
ncbi:MAG: response regulator transcription factor [Acidobacteria bacterium]|jgi:two-component system response regulator CpxR|nr:response regulator transcription factor [Acidobacteriota bacterium]